MIVCHVCGTENPDGAKFCEGCGVELAPENAAAAPVESVAVSSAPAMPAVEATPALTGNAPVEMPPLGETPVGSVAASEPVTPAAETSSAVTSPAPEAPMPAVPMPEVAAAQPSAATSIEMPLEEIMLGAPPSGPIIVEPDVKSTMSDSGQTTAPASDKPKVARLVPRALGAAAGEGYVLNSGNMVVGRFDPSAGPVDIDLAGQSGEGYISRRHAELYLENGQWMVRDLGSTNGVYLKKAGQGQYSPRLIEPAALNDGDEVAFGNVKFLFLNSSEA
jgi:FHA domain/zinc-ribbon domain